MTINPTSRTEVVRLLQDAVNHISYGIQSNDLAVDLKDLIHSIEIGD